MNKISVIFLSLILTVNTAFSQDELAKQILDELSEKGNSYDLGCSTGTFLSKVSRRNNNYKKIKFIGIDEIKDMWKTDCQIDDIELDKSSLEVPKLHAKYSELLTDNSLRLKQLNLKYQIALKDKWMYFNGKMDDDTIREKGWNLNPFDGLKIMKNDMHIFFNADEELQKMNAQVEYYKEVDAFLKRCMENITSQRTHGKT